MEDFIGLFSPPFFFHFFFFFPSETGRHFSHDVVFLTVRHGSFWMRSHGRAGLNTPPG